MELKINGRYWLFGGECYYATGGFHDFRGSFETIEEATKDAEERPFDADNPRRGPVEWWHIFDSEAREIVSQSKDQPYGAE